LEIFPVTPQERYYNKQLKKDQVRVSLWIPKDRRDEFLALAEKFRTSGATALPDPRPHATPIETLMR
jgi:hypothetical protein